MVNILDSLRAALKRGQGGSPGLDGGQLTGEESDHLSDILDMMRVVSVETGQSHNTETGLAGQLQLRFWEAVSAGLLEKGHQTRAPQARQYLDVTLGRTGFFLSNVILTRRREMAVRLLLAGRDGKQNDKFLKRLLSEREKIERDLGASLEWSQPGERGQKRISLSRPLDITSDQQFTEAVDWMVTWIARFKEVFGPLVKNF